jgi:3-keto-disaccharide hydrolase
MANSQAVFRGVVVACLLLAGTAVFSEELSEEEKNAGFVSMFNGKDFTGWRFAQDEKPSNWMVKNGVIQLTGGGKPNLGTEKAYRDFEMKFEWRALAEKYNSGFFIRSGKDVGKNQINLAKGSEGKFLGELMGSKAVPDMQKPAGEWNEWRVLVVGEKVKFWCNGKLAWEGSGISPKEGHIGLQAEGAPLEFRHLRIREIADEQ